MAELTTDEIDPVAAIAKSGPQFLVMPGEGLVLPQPQMLELGWKPKGSLQITIGSQPLIMVGRSWFFPHSCSLKAPTQGS